MNAGARARLTAGTTTLLEYLAIEEAPEPADIIWALGSADLRVAEKAAALYERGLSSWIVFAGGVGHRWALAEAEAELFARTAIARGVPAERLMVENQSTNTAENVRLSLAMLDERGVKLTSALLITIPPFQRRASITVRTHRPSVRTINSPVAWGSPVGWNDEELVRVATLCTGEIERLREYPARGFLRWDPAELPAEVLAAAASVTGAL